MRCPDFCTIANWLYSKPRVGRLAGFAVLWFIVSAAIDMDFYNVMFTTNTASQRAAFSEAGAATGLTAFTITVGCLAFQLGVIAVTGIKVVYSYPIRTGYAVDSAAADMDTELKVNPQREFSDVTVT